MDLLSKIKRFLKEAELYQKQGLLTEAKEKYDTAIELISQHNVKNREKLIGGILKKIKSLEIVVDKVEGATSTPEVSKIKQDLIKQLFSFSKGQDEDTAMLEGAIALTKFGQYERALEEFGKLINREALRLVAAKNIIRCHVATDSTEAASQQFSKWLSGDLFTHEQLKKLRSFFQNILNKKGLKIPLPEIETVPQNDVVEIVIDEKLDEDEVLDISSVGITPIDGPSKGQMSEFDVSFQSGNIISLLISKKDKDLLDYLSVGDKLNDVQFFSPITFFSGIASVIEKNEIKVGPRKGDHSVDLKVEGS
jgi:tetratricopeptide (TPR) repeat protein